ncbi:MAG: hypothetical protein WA921_08155 [Ahrensia sp.]
MPNKLTLLDSISRNGSAQKPNEDAFGFHDHAAFVIDGATCLGDNIVTGEIGSDAAWLAEFCRVHFLEMLADDETTKEIIAKTNALVGHLISYLTAKDQPPAWQLPVASFQMLRLVDNQLVSYGLGDCVAYVEGAENTVQTISPMGDHGAEEMSRAREAILRAGGLNTETSLLDDKPLLEIERALRGTYNTPGGPLWTLGTAPDAAHHIHEQPAPTENGTIALICTDGFSALVDKYQRYTPANLLQKAKADGLQALADELRHIEQVEDPDGHHYPRLKASDDATAVLVRIGG